jgi:hypothetical protein
MLSELDNSSAMSRLTVLVTLFCGMSSIRGSTILMSHCYKNKEPRRTRMWKGATGRQAPPVYSFPSNCRRILVKSA